MFDELNTEEQEPEQQKTTDYSGLIILAITLPVLILFDYIGRMDMGLSVTICLGMNLVAIRLRWKLRKLFWFWATIIFAFGLELPLILMIPWPQIKINRITLLPIGFAVFVITWGAINFIEKFVVKYIPPDEEE
jgi:hypothetical protein